MFFFILIKQNTVPIMSKIQEFEPEIQSSCSESIKLEDEKLQNYLDQDKIQSFYQARTRLQKFVSHTKSLSFDQNLELSRYLSKFQKTQNRITIDGLGDEDVVNLAQQRVQRMIKSHKLRKNWTLDDRKILDWVVIHFALLKKYKNIEKEFTKDDWKYVASLIPGANTNSCMFKWLSLHKTNLYEASWSQQESQMLKQLLSKYVNANKSIRWKDVCKKLYLQNKNPAKNYRTQKQCKQHWIFKLNPNIKRQPWTQEEDILLLQTIKQNSGLKKWVEMVKLFKGRTENAVKNRFNLIIEKERKFIDKNKDQLDLIDAYLQRCYVEKFTKIIEPDSQERKIETDKVQKKKIKKPKSRKKEKKEIMIKYEPLLLNENEKKEGLGKIGEECRFDKIDKGQLIDELGQQSTNNGRAVQDFISIQNLQQIGNYNHRANDTEYNFMYLESSINY